jgi:hypothetical protein
MHLAPTKVRPTGGWGSYDKFTICRGPSPSPIFPKKLSLSLSLARALSARSEEMEEGEEANMLNAERSDSYGVRSTIYRFYINKEIHRA